MINLELGNFYAFKGEKLNNKLGDWSSWKETVKEITKRKINDDEMSL